MMTKYHLTWSSKHTAVRSVEQAAYVILMPTLTPHDASSDRASHRYFHLSQWVASRRLRLCGDHIRNGSLWDRLQIMRSLCEVWHLHTQYICLRSTPSSVANFGSTFTSVAFAQRTCAYLWLSISIHASTLAARIMRG